MKTFGPASEGRDNHFNLLRMLAASGVLVSHAWPITLGPGTTEPLSDLLGHTLGTLCVFVFFAISGFYITRSFDRRDDWRAFLEARLRRLFPALFVILLLAVLVGAMLTTASFGEYIRSAIRYVLRGLSLEFLVHDLAGVFEDNPYPKAVNGSLWTLKHEFFCYMVVFFAGLAGAFRRVWMAKVLVLVLIALTAGIQAAGALDMLPDGMRTNRVQLGLPFALGAAIYLWRARLPMSWVLLAALGVLAWLTQGTALATPILQVGLSYGVLMLGFAPFPALLAYNKLGDYSYGFYIFAFPIQQLLAYWGVLALGPHIALAAAATCICAVISWHVIEKPAMTGRRFWQSPKPAATKA